MKKFLSAAIIMVFIFSSCPTTESPGQNDGDFTITFDVNKPEYNTGTVVNPPAEITVGKGAEAPRPANPSLVGYTFGGWYTDYECTASFDFANTRVTKSYTLYAKWTPVKYNVVYNRNAPAGVTVAGTMASTEHIYDVPMALRENAYTNIANFIFKGWNTGANGSGTGYADRENVKNLSSTADATVTLFAVWELWQSSIFFTVTFNSNGGTPVDPIQVREFETAEMPENPVNPPKIFAGWYREAELENLFNFNTPVTGEITLWAKWEDAAGNWSTDTVADTTNQPALGLPAESGYFEGKSRTDVIKVSMSGGTTENNVTQDPMRVFDTDTSRNWSINANIINMNPSPDGVIPGYIAVDLMESKMINWITLNFNAQSNADRFKNMYFAITNDDAKWAALKNNPSHTSTDAELATPFSEIIGVDTGWSVFWSNPGPEKMQQNNRINLTTPGIGRYVILIGEIDRTQSRGAIQINYLQYAYVAPETTE